MTTPAIEAHGIELAYRLSRNRATTLKEFAFQLVKRQVKHEQLHALKGVSFTAHPGEVLGIIGPNGAGKSTLMKVVARVLPPSGGRVIVRGSVAAMIELGAGLNPELTAYENIVLYGTLLGRSPEHMRTRADAIADWAGLTAFLDVPVRSFSSGMLARLGFAIATDVEPQVLVVDEVLSVGDEQFQRKSMDRMSRMISGGTAVVFVSHDLGKVREMADRVMWLDRGEVVATGDPHEVVDAYQDASRELA